MPNKKVLQKIVTGTKRVMGGFYVLSEICFRTTEGLGPRKSLDTSHTAFIHVYKSRAAILQHNFLPQDELPLESLEQMTAILQHWLTSWCFYPFVIQLITYQKTVLCVNSCFQMIWQYTLNWSIILILVYYNKKSNRTE